MTLMRVLLCIGFCSVTLCAAETQIVAQDAFGENACGPCAIVNALSHATPQFKAILKGLGGDTAAEKVNTLIKKLGRTPSPTYGKDETVYHPDRGITWADMAPALNSLVSDAGAATSLDGQFLDRRADETLEGHLKRIHTFFAESIDAGMPLVTGVRSFAPAWNEEKKEYEWEGLTGHYIVVTEVQKTLRPGEKGFQFTFVDSFTGAVEYGYAAIDEARNFSAAKGNNRKWEWLTDRPFLLLTAPSLRLGTQNQAWFLRTIITLNYAAGKARPR